MVRPFRAVALRTDAIRLRMSSYAALTLAEGALLLNSGAMGGRIWARHATVESAANDTGPSYITSGWAAHSRRLKDGRRQIVQLLLPGDPIIPFHLTGVRQEITCLTQVRSVDGKAIQLAAGSPDRFPGIAAATAKAAALDRAMLVEHVVRLGRKTAQERMAGLFLELHGRCAAVGLTSGDSLAFPLTQEMLADLLGLSVVHVNRTLQQLRRDGLVELKHGNLTLPYLATLNALAAY